MIQKYIHRIITKCRIIKVDALHKGYRRALLDNLYEFIYKRRFRKIGVHHPDNITTLSDTNQRSVNKDAHANQPSSFYCLRKAFSKINIDHKNICMLDIGCGSGRVLSYGMLLSFKRVSGIDLDQEALTIAANNCKQMQQSGYTTMYEVQAADATVFNIPECVNVVYMFNPFGEKTMEQTLANLINHCKTLGHKIYVVYSNPVYLHIFEKSKEAKKIFESFFKDGSRDVAIFQMCVNNN